ncbi:MAG: flavin reductase family protein [Pseudomonadota bacterium]
MSFDGRELRSALGQFATGVCVITVHNSEQQALGMTANSFSSVSLDPPLVLWSLQKGSEVFEAFATPQVFGISVLAAEQVELSNQCAKKGDHRLPADYFVLGESGVPVIKDALVSFECTLDTTHEGGDHVIIVGRVEHMTTRGEGQPLLFFSGAYRELG